MSKFKELCSSSKNKVVTGLNKATNHCKEHSKEYINIMCGVTIVSLGACIALKMKNDGLYRKNINLEKDNKVLENIIKNDNIRIELLEDMCEEKDRFFKMAISDSLKHRSSFGGKQMAARKEYLKEISVCS